jgi:CheY-like chemotaxis protein
MQIVILEDNDDRRAHMRDCLQHRLPQHEVHFFVSATDMISHLQRSGLDGLRLIVLDHDLELLPAADGKLVDPGTGRDVADYLATHAPVCPIVIHTTNAPAGVGMQTVLEEAGWSVTRVVPYGDHEWIGQTWLGAVRDAITGTAR